MQIERNRNNGNMGQRQGRHYVTRCAELTQPVPKKIMIRHTEPPTASENHITVLLVCQGYLWHKAL